MAEFTPRLKLRLFSDTDKVSREALNANFLIIDEEVVRRGEGSIVLAGRIFPDNPEPFMLFYRIDEKKLYIFDVSNGPQWIEL